MTELANAFDASTIDQKAGQIGPAGIDIAYQHGGNSQGPVVLLIMGLAAQGIHWPDGF